MALWIVRAGKHGAAAVPPREERIERRKESEGGGRLPRRNQISDWRSGRIALCG